MENNKDNMNTFIDYLIDNVIMPELIMASDQKQEKVKEEEPNDGRFNERLKNQN